MTVVWEFFFFPRQEINMHKAHTLHTAQTHAPSLNSCAKFFWTRWRVFVPSQHSLWLAWVAGSNLRPKVAFGVRLSKSFPSEADSDLLGREVLSSRVTRDCSHSRCFSASPIFFSAEQVSRPWLKASFSAARCYRHSCLLMSAKTPVDRSTCLIAHLFSQFSSLFFKGSGPPGGWGWSWLASGIFLGLNSSNLTTILPFSLVMFVRPSPSLSISLQPPPLDRSMPRYCVDCFKNQSPPGNGAGVVAEAIFLTSYVQGSHTSSGGEVGT